MGRASEVLRLASWGAGALIRYGRPDVVLHFSAGIGDEILCTCVCRELYRRGSPRIHVMSNRPELFRENPDVAAVVPVDPRHLALARRCGARVLNPIYTHSDPADGDRDLPTPVNILLVMLASAGIRGDVTLRPYLTLTENEKARWSDLGEYIVVQSSGLDAIRPMRTKEYFPERFQVVADRLRAHYRLIQIGSPKDPAIAGATDLRGRTSLRETAAVMARARIFLGLEGAMMHLARAVDCPAVIVQGGHTTSEQFGYPCNIQLERRPDCSPCWRYNGCDRDFVCMREIGADEVYAACETLLARPREAILPATQANISETNATDWLAALQ